ncbi:YtxH domain-containing protein [Pedobacter sp. SYP-B3415]|uniref:YtxH domain-containing protein n=1 Tax=Pedobacter sp. SYP-B3415 TaxID=2496641 RepID=UPI00101C33CA|nr:YtxH domain-containing protein [Pedobacter sp. SYP-B3415]
MTKETKILTGVLAGAALGAVAALLITTSKNDNITSKVSDWFCDLFDSSKDKISHLADKVTSAASDVADKAKDKYSDLKA